MGHGLAWGYRKAPDGLTVATDFTGLLGGFGVEDDEGESSALRISEGGGGGHAELDIPVDLAPTGVRVAVVIGQPAEIGIDDLLLFGDL